MPLSISPFSRAGLSPPPESEDVVIVMSGPRSEHLPPVPPSGSGLDEGKDNACSKSLQAPSCQQSLAKESRGRICASHPARGKAAPSGWHRG